MLNRTRKKKGWTCSIVREKKVERAQSYDNHTFIIQAFTYICIYYKKHRKRVYRVHSCINTYINIFIIN